jgi:hypothetical protein
MNYSQTRKFYMVVPVTSILQVGKLPVVRAGDFGTIPHKYRTATRSDAYLFDAQTARADSRPGAGDGCAMYFVTAWALGWTLALLISSTEADNLL